MEISTNVFSLEGKKFVSDCNCTVKQRQGIMDQTFCEQRLASSAAALVIILNHICTAALVEVGEAS